MSPSTAAQRTAFSVWRMARISNRKEIWESAHDSFFGMTLYAGALGNYEDESYLNELAEAATEIAADCR